MDNDIPIYLELCSETKQYEQRRVFHTPQVTSFQEEKHMRMQMNVAYQDPDERTGNMKYVSATNVKTSNKRKYLCAATIIIAVILILVLLVALSAASSVTIQSL